MNWKILFETLKELGLTMVILLVVLVFLFLPFFLSFHFAFTYERPYLAFLGFIPVFTLSIYLAYRKKLEELKETS